ncbi:tetratricopeptide repeat protein [Leptospira weilii serovar Ranarum str. ICFT]|uniref:Tetratricopeptide repeat protein n=1 Tax=Leptospira weilii serovar Ranarum str. ICFT TaxID=1218598 RepID=N1WRR7_9LEPT|nr:tetratricopeptide repeat protein [Leptospira weilii]EMY78508.1 tetratricopeptide repeat protein [Leptospira weilii serovar Ranarum str. ICFT]
MKRIRTLEYLIILICLSFADVLFAIELDPGGNRVDEGLERYNRGEYADSLKMYQEAESYFPEDPRLEFNRGAAEFKSGNIDKAIRHFEKSATSTSPEVQWKSRFNLGNGYMRTGDRKKAAEEYIKALKLKPDLKEARKNLEYLRRTPPSSQTSPNSSPQSKDSKNSPSSNQNQPESRGAGNGDQSQDDEVRKRDHNGARGKKDRLTEEETKRILDSLDLNKVRRKSGKSRDREVFW